MLYFSIAHLRYSKICSWHQLLVWSSPIDPSIFSSQSEHPKQTWCNFTRDDLFVGLAPSVNPCCKHESGSLWPDWAIYWNLCNFLKPLATIKLPKLPTFLGNFCKGIKIYHFLVKSFLGNFYRYLAIFSWSHWFRSKGFKPPRTSDFSDRSDCRSVNFNVCLS